MQLVENPFQIFLDLAGSPLENGYLYIGEENQDPETHPIDVFYDEDGAIPAVQPIRTISGYPARLGAPAKLYVEEEAYSIRARTAQSVQVFYDVSHNPASGSGGGDFGLFSDLGDLAIPEDQTIITSSGYDIPGLGRGTYREDSDAVPADHPRFIKADANGRIFRLIGPRIDPLMGGAHPATATSLQVTCVDNLADCQALERYAYSIDPNNERLIVDHSVAAWGLSDKYTIETHYYRSHIYIGGMFKYTGAGALDTLIEIDGQPRTKLLGGWDIFGYNGTTGLKTMAVRKVKRGFVFRNCNSGEFGTFYFDGFRRYAFEAYDDGNPATNNNIGLEIGEVYSAGCGVFGRGAYNLSSTFTATHAGSSGALDTSQYSELTLANATMYDDLEVGDALVFMGEVYHVMAKPSANVVRVYPWITAPADPTTNINSGTIWGAYGGAVHIRHNIAEGMRFGKVTAVFSGCGIKQSGAYRFAVDEFLGESSSSCFEIGLASGSVCRGLGVKNYHTEGMATAAETISSTPYATGFEGIIYSQVRGDISIDGVSAMSADGDFNPLYGWRFVRSQSANATRGTKVASIAGLSIRFNGKFITSQAGGVRSYAAKLTPNQLVSNASDLCEGKIVIVDTTVVALTTFYDGHEDALCGPQHCQWTRMVVGTGTNGAPTGNVTVALGATDAAAGYQINGGTGTVTFAAGAPRALLLHGYFDYEASPKNWVVKNLWAT
jgi:hypothetical protein